MSDEESHCYLSLENKKSGLEKVWKKLLNNPPQSFPTGAGREPWESMKTFLSNPEEKAKLLDQLKVRKGEHLTDFTLRYKNRKKQASEYLENVSLCYLNRKRQTDRGNSRKSGNCAAKEKDTKDF